MLSAPPATIRTSDAMAFTSNPYAEVTGFATSSNPTLKATCLSTRSDRCRLGTPFRPWAVALLGQRSDPACEREDVEPRTPGYGCGFVPVGPESGVGATGWSVIVDHHSMWSELLALASAMALVHFIDHLRTHRLHGKS